MEEIKVIVNPYAGRGRGARSLEAVKRGLAGHDIPFSLDVSPAPGGCVGLARRAAEAGYAIVAAAGGDGTVSEVVNGLAQAADAASRQTVGTLAVLPVGSANDMAVMAGVPQDLAAACQAIRDGRTRRIDLGKVNDRYFDNNVGAGFEARVTLESYRIKRLRGTLLYLIAVFRALTGYPLPVMRVTWDGGTVHKPLLMVSIGNSRRTGGGFYITPDAELDDGLLDIGVANALPALGILRLLPKVMRGAHRNDPAILLTRTTSVVIESDSPLPVHADGEVIYTDAHRLDVSIQPGRLEMIV